MDWYPWLAMAFLPFAWVATGSMLPAGGSRLWVRSLRPLGWPLVGRTGLSFASWRLGDAHVLIARLSSATYTTTCTEHRRQLHPESSENDGPGSREPEDSQHLQSKQGDVFRVSREIRVGTRVADRRPQASCGV